MRIGIDIRNVGKKRTGDEAVFFNLVKNLALIDNKNEYHLFTDIRNEEMLLKISKSLGIENKSNFKIISLSAKNRFAWNFWTLAQYLRKNPVDIYHTQYITPWFVPKKIKIVTIVHDISFNFFPQFINFFDLLFLRILIPISLRRADKIIGVSQFTCDEIIRFYKINPEKVECVLNSIAYEFLSENISDEQKEAIRKKYNLPEKFILYIGTLQPRKNIPMLVEAYTKAKEKLDGAKVVICGNRKGRNFDTRIDEAVKKNQAENDIVFPGFIDEEDKQTIFCSARAFAFPSLYEGFGLPLIEAMIQGVPVIAADIPSLKEVGGDAALYFNPNSLEDFAQKLCIICADEELRKKLIAAGKERVNHFSWKKSAQKTLAIYEKLYHN